jgi:hypothetical protein
VRKVLSESRQYKYVFIYRHTHTHTHIPEEDTIRGKHTAPQPAFSRSGVWAAMTRAAQVDSAKEPNRSAGMGLIGIGGVN